MIYSESMLSGQVCKFNELASKSDKSQEECLANYSNDPEEYILKAGFRYDTFLCGVYLPVVFFAIEFFLNQILISWKHIVYQYVFTLCYAVITASWQTLTGDAVIFPKTLDWICASREGGAEGCIFNECIMWFIVFILVQTGCFSLVLLLHFLKSKYCCRQSVPIITYNPNQIEKLGSIMSQKRD